MSSSKKIIKYNINILLSIEITTFENCYLWVKNHFTQKIISRINSLLNLEEHSVLECSEIRNIIILISIYLFGK